MIKYTIPTGYLIVDDYKNGKLETLSIGDYGKSKNIKADFLGFKNEINGVSDGYCLPLSEKWVITLSTQYGCRMNCIFCDVPKIKFNGNVDFDDLKKQFYSAIQCFKKFTYTDRLNVHFARMGEPIFNDDVFIFSEWLYKNKINIKNDVNLSIETIHPVLTTSLPNFYDIKFKLMKWIDIKNNLYNGQAGLQLSINSTNEKQRKYLFKNMSMSIEQISRLCERFKYPIGRKYCLNFAYSNNFEIDPIILLKYFDKDKFMIKLTPIHNNISCSKNGIKTINGYSLYEPYRNVENEIKNAGFDVIIFIPSIDEEEGLVTCGNAVLSNNNIKIVKNPKIMGL